MLQLPASGAMKVAALLLAVVATVLSACTVVDLPYEPIGAFRPDKSALAELVTRGASEEEIVGKLGRPSEKAVDSNGDVRLTYTYLLRRESEHHLLGIALMSDCAEYKVGFRLNLVGGRLHSWNSEPTEAVGPCRER